MKIKKFLSMAAIAALSVGILAGCGQNGGGGTTTANTPSESTGPKTVVFGDTTFNAENEEANMNPHEAYCGWACIRYGVGETLFRINETMGLDPWVAAGYENVDDNTWKITIKDGVVFSNGKACDAQAVKDNLQHLIDVHERAAGDLAIASMDVDGNVLTIKTQHPNPSFVNYLCEPYGCIIDVEAGVTSSGIPVGTGPYVATELVTDDHINLVKNDKYWNGNVKVDEVKVRTISDGDTLALALQSGEIDMAYGMAYASYPLFENSNYKFTSTQTSRAFYGQFNFTSDIGKDPAIRKAIAMGINKEGFVNTLLNGYGYVAKGAFPDEVAFGGKTLKAEKYDPEAAKKVLEDAGWTDTDGDGYRDKGGKKLTVRWLTYPSRQELPLLAESAQATLKDIGMDIQINSTPDVNTIVKDQSQWDIYVGANVNCGLGDPANFFSTHTLDSSTKNRGSYHNDKLEELAAKLGKTFDKDERAELAIEMQQVLLDDNAFVFCSFLKMSMITKANVAGVYAWPSDYYEITVDLEKN